MNILQIEKAKNKILHKLMNSYISGAISLHLTEFYPHSSKKNIFVLTVYFINNKSLTMETTEKKISIIVFDFLEKVEEDNSIGVEYLKYA